MGSENGWGRRFPGKRAGVPDRDNSGKSSKGKRVLVLVMVWAWVFCAWGCDRQARHQVLTFFFTGVPPLEEEKPKEQAVARPSAIKKKKEKKQVPASKGKTFSHTPYAIGACSECHPASRGSNIVKSRPGKYGMLTLTPDKLCTKCHVYKSNTRAIKKDLRLHSPVAQGHCAICHSPHQSKKRYMLLDNPEALCLRCHAQKDLTKSKAHKGPDWIKCNACHNPHIGTTMQLLDKDLY